VPCVASCPVPTSDSFWCAAAPRCPRSHSQSFACLSQPDRASYKTGRGISTRLRLDHFHAGAELAPKLQAARLAARAERIRRTQQDRFPFANAMHSPSLPMVVVLARFHSHPTTSTTSGLTHPKLSLSSSEFGRESPAVSSLSSRLSSSESLICFPVSAGRANDLQDLMRSINAEVSRNQRSPLARRECLDQFPCQLRTISSKRSFRFLTCARKPPCLHAVKKSGTFFSSLFGFRFFRMGFRIRFWIMSLRRGNLLLSTRNS